MEPFIEPHFRMVNQFNNLCYQDIIETELFREYTLKQDILEKRKLPGNHKYIESKVEQCDQCIRRKTPVRPAAGLVPTETTRPMELVCVDFLSLEPSKGGYENILVITDHFTRYEQAVPCKNQTAHTTAKALYDNFIRYYSFPERLHSDQGRNFESKIIKELCGIANGTLEEHQKSDWKTYIPPLVQAYNATRSDATGFSPHYSMFGWHPRLSVDAYLGLEPNNNDKTDHSTYIEKLRERMAKSYQVATSEANKIAAKNKQRYDENIRKSKIEVGDRILVRKVGLQGRQKLADKWEKEPYVVVNIPHSDPPVYKVKLESRNGSIRTLHRNMLLPFNVIPAMETTNVTPQRPCKTKVRPVQNNNKQMASSSSSESDSSGDETRKYIIPQRRTRKVGHYISEDQVSSISNQTNQNQVSERFETTMDRQVTPPQLLPRRSTGNRKPPDRYGEWQCTQQVQDSHSFDQEEIFV